MKIIIGFTEQAKADVLAWQHKVCKHEIVDEDAAINEVFNKVSDRVPGKHEPEFEMSQHQTKSGRPELIGFSDDDFIWEDVEE